jgi:5'-nucleotidase
MVISKKSRSMILLSVLFFTLALASAPASPTRQEPYRILVTNDDGIEAPGIHALARELGKNNEVIVVAPSENQSGSSMSVSGGDLVRIEKYEKNGELFGYGINGTPARAVFFGILEVAKDKKIDLVVSGINAGQNVGDIGHFSGTVGAAMTALFFGVPSVAVSLDSRANDYTFAARYTARFVEQLKTRGAPEGVVLSINFPAATPEEIQGVVPARMGGSVIEFGFEKRQDPRGRPYYWRTGELNTDFEPGTDSHAYQEKWITITPLRFDWTDYKMLEELKGWDLGLK